jgi:large subunit ribosomal protein L17
MRHSRVINHLGRTSSHRKAMLANMATSLIIHKKITTTTAKAKALRTFVEPLITKSKLDSTHSRRVVFSYLKDKTAVAELFRDVSPKIAERPGGYTRILKIGNRIGDNADMCILELVDYNEAMVGGEAAKTKTTRRRRAPKKKEEAIAGTKAPKAVKEKTEKAGKAEKPISGDEKTTDKPVPEE